jgi:hypothetical protein
MERISTLTFARWLPTSQTASLTCRTFPGGTHGSHIIRAVEYKASFTAGYRMKFVLQLGVESGRYQSIPYGGSTRFRKRPDNHAINRSRGTGRIRNGKSVAATRLSQMLSAMEYMTNLPLISVAIIVFATLGCGGNDDSRGQLEDRSQMNNKTLSGQIAIGKLPPHFGLSVSVAFFPVADADTPKPLDGDPPVEAIVDCPNILEDVDLNVERMDESRLVPYQFERPSGYYYIQIRAILYRKENGRVFAQKEDFFFGRRPLPLIQDLESVTLPVDWPSIPLEELGSYGTIKPQTSR